VVLLTKTLMLDYVKAQKIGIENNEFKFFGRNYYYFRLGSKAKRWDKKEQKWEEQVLDQDNSLILEEKGYAMFFSYEKISTNEHVFGMLGQFSKLQSKGLRLNYSPSVDTMFNGYLELGIENLLNIQQKLEFREIVGKILFFDCLDSINTSDLDSTWVLKKEQNRRERIWTLMDTHETHHFE
jgi:deoxycytidine triphosphate deaminase